MLSYVFYLTLAILSNKNMHSKMHVCDYNEPNGIFASVSIHLHVKN